MLDELLRRDDVSTFIKKIRTSERYYKKSKNSYMNLSFHVDYEIALYVFYDALLKYKIVVDDIYLFDEYLEQLEKLYRKLNNIEDISIGINRLVARMVSIKLGFRNVPDRLSRKVVISYIYNKYILDGYFIHGFNSTYFKDIEEKGFVPEVYENYYKDFIELNRIFVKYGVANALVKDFTSNKVYFTDDIVLACYYSKYAPLFFYKFLHNEEYFDKKTKLDAYEKDDFVSCTRALKKMMHDLSFSEKDRKTVSDLVKKEWNLLHKKNNKKISLMLVKSRKIYGRECVKLEDFLEDKNDLGEVVDRLLSSKNNSVYCTDAFSQEDVELILLEDYYDDSNSVKCKEVEFDTSSYSFDGLLNKEILNAYGRISTLLILGSLFISLGVIISIFMILGGM